MKKLIGFLFPLLLIVAAGCSEDSPSGPGVPQETNVNISNTTPNSPATLKYYKTSSNDRVSISFNYNVVEPGGARIWVQPVKSSDDATIYYSTSPVYKGTGNKSVIVSVYSEEDTTYVSKLRVIVKTPDQSSTISESFVDVNYTFTK